MSKPTHIRSIFKISSCRDWSVCKVSHPSNDSNLSLTSWEHWSYTVANPFLRYWLRMMRLMDTTLTNSTLTMARSSVSGLFAGTGGGRLIVCKTPVLIVCATRYASFPTLRWMYLEIFSLDWVNWSANLLWPMLKVSVEISTIGYLNAFDTNGVRPLYPTPLYPWPPHTPQPSFFTYLPRPVSTCCLIIIELIWFPIHIIVSVRWRFAFVFPFLNNLR